MIFTARMRYLRDYTRHSLVLIVGGAVYFIYGFIIQQWVPGGPRTSAISAGLGVVTLEMWSYLWMLTGAIIVLSGRWPAKSAEKWGYVLLTGMSCAWAAVYFAGLIFENNTLAEASGGVIWALIAFLWWSIAGLISPEKVLKVKQEE